MSAIEAKAVIFDIQSFSLKDGPGIRTAVFFKGCPLRCRWCHNPESHSPRPQLMFHAKLCVGCMRCVDACKRGAHRRLLVDSAFVHVLDRDACVDCGDCVEACCYGALDMTGREYTPASLFAEIQKDVRYYRLNDEEGGDSGGVTFTGGEPMLYPDFIAEFRALAPDIHIAVETSGFADQAAFEKALDSIDLFLFDYKLTSPGEHEAWCGADNARILANLDFLHERGKEIILRLPLIPGANDTLEHARGAADLLRRHPTIRKAEVLPYHTYGLGKLDELGLSADPALPEKAADPEKAAQWAESLRRFAGGEAAIVLL